MPKKQKATPAPRTPAISYYCEQIGEPHATVDPAIVLNRLNAIGAQGWQLVCWTTEHWAWFMQQGQVPPPDPPAGQE